MMGFEKIPSIVTMNMGITAAVSILLPVILLIVWTRKNKVKVKPFFIGALTFFVMVFVLESICHQFVLVQDNALSRFVNGNTIIYILYAIFAAGIFEETGRYLAFKFLMNRDKNKETAITYGIGHGGIESILIIGVGMLSSIVLVATLNGMGGMDNYLQLVPAETQELLKPTLVTLYTTPPYTYLITALERITTILFHIALSVFVFTAAKRTGKFILFPLAIGLHAFFDLFAVLYQRQIIKSLLLTEAILMLITAGVIYLAYRIYRQDEQNPLPESDMESDMEVM